MRIISNTLHTLAAAAIIAAIWSPWHWQFAATAVLLLLAGAMAHGSRQIVADQVTEGADLISRDIAAANERKTSQNTTRPTYGKQADQ